MAASRRRDRRAGSSTCGPATSAAGAARRRRPRRPSIPPFGPAGGKPRVPPPAPMPVRSKLSVVCVTAQPLPAPPMRSASSHDRVVEEHLVEHRVAGHLAQRPDRDAGLVEREREPRDARVLRARRSRCGRAACRSRRSIAMLLHTFWPLMIQRSPSRSARVVEPGEVGAGAGLAEQLAPADLPFEDRRHEAGDLVGGAVREDRRRGHEQPEAAGRAQRAVTPRTPARTRRCRRGGAARARPARR